MAEMNYLTVQDMLWINLRVTGKPSQWHFMKLEESTFYQFAYGKSTDTVGQAARFVSGFASKAPFSAGNEATAFVAALTFLRINGLQFNLSDDAGSNWFAKATNKDQAHSAIEEILGLEHGDEFGHHEDESAIKEIADSIVVQYPKTLAALSTK